MTFSNKFSDKIKKNGGSQRGLRSDSPHMPHVGVRFFKKAFRGLSPAGFIIGLSMIIRLLGSLTFTGQMFVPPSPGAGSATWRSDGASARSARTTAGRQRRRRRAV